MSFQMALELKAIRGQILDLLKRIESLEESREESLKRRPILTVKPEYQKAANVQK